METVTCCLRSVSHLNVTHFSSLDRPHLFKLFLFLPPRRNASARMSDGASRAFPSNLCFTCPQPLMPHVVFNIEPYNIWRGGVVSFSNIVNLCTELLQRGASSLSTALTLQAVVFVSQDRGRLTCHTSWLFLSNPCLALKCLSSLLSLVFPSLLTDLKRPPLRLNWIVFYQILKCGVVSVKKNNNFKVALRVCETKSRIVNSSSLWHMCKLGLGVLGIAA